jgi:dienelactone hydrolase
MAIGEFLRRDRFEPMIAARLPRVMRAASPVALALMSMAMLAGCATESAVATDSSAARAPPGAATPPMPAPRIAPERVTFDSLDRDPKTGVPVRLTGLLFHPSGRGGGPHPAVIAFHGCGGMYSTLATRRDSLSLRHQGMAELLAHEGYVVLFPDSFRSRGFEEICTIPFRRFPVSVAKRLADAQGALAYLQSRTDVAPGRIAALGWSHGGSTVLAIGNAKEPAVARWHERTGSPAYFRAGVALYPGCIDSLRAPGGYAVAAPLAMFVAGADDWTAPKPCIDLAERLIAAKEPVTITVYPDTHHGFDGPPSQGRLRLEVPNGVNPGAGVTVAPNAAARDDAYAKLKRFLRAEMGPR